MLKYVATAVQYVNIQMVSGIPILPASVSV